MNKYGSFSKADKLRLYNDLHNYWKRNKKALHPTFLDGAEYIIKHLNINLGH